MNCVDNVFDITALGTVVRFRFEDDVRPDLRHRLEDAWSGAKVESPAPDAEILITDGEQREHKMQWLTSLATLRAIESRRGELLMFHAAGVADDGGRVAAFVGPSGHGKTTLSSHLGQRYGYVSDETIAIDSDYRVYPYRKPLSVVREGKPKQQVSPAEAGLRELPQAPLRLVSLALFERDEALTQTTIEPVDFAEAIVELVPQISYLPDVPNPLQTMATLADQVGGFVRIRYSEASSVVDVLPEFFTRGPRSRTWSEARSSKPGPLSIAVVDDAINVDGHVIVLSEGTVHVLDGIAPKVWDAVRAGKDRAGITDHVIEIFGEPTDADAQKMVDAAIDTLVAAGVLSVS